LEVASTPKIAAQPETASACATSGDRAALDAADWLNLAGTPTFALMALLTAVIGGGAMDIGMVTMYLLMSAFHAAHWLKLVSSRGSGPRQP
jgi:hypothetical protein